MQSAQGFTLIELIAMVVLIAIVSTLAIPAWQSSVQRSQVASDARTLSQAFTLARSEAVTRGVQVSVCPLSMTAAATRCGDDWQDGWLVYLGNSDNFQTDKRLRVYQGSQAREIAGKSTRVTFNPRGMASAFSSWSFCSGDHGMSIFLARSGRIGKIPKGSCQ